MQKTANDFPNNGDWKCASCVFFDERDPDYGFCRRNAPVAKEQKTFQLAFSDWPIVKPESRCGEWVSFERK